MRPSRHHEALTSSLPAPEASPGGPLRSDGGADVSVGENGVGKSTLLRTVAGLDAPDRGSVSRPPELGYVGQDGADAPGTTVGPGVLAPDRPVARLSGGQRTRLELAALIARRPTCVVFEEPINHLDADALDFLEEFLADLPVVVLVASHDRTLLDRVCRTVVDLDPAQGGATRFTGSFSDYLEAKRAARAQWERDFAAQREELDVLRDAARTSSGQIGATPSSGSPRSTARSSPSRPRSCPSAPR